MRVAFAALFLIGCGPGNECLDRADCGDLQVCDRGRCKVVDCATSTDCGIGEYCDPVGNTCKTGCESDGDCVAGEACDLETRECRAYECRTTALDCGLGESCRSGECENTLGDACTPCDGYDYYNSACGSGTCFNFGEAYSYGETYCLMPCDRAYGVDECPRGFECQDIPGAGLFCAAWCPAILVELGD